MTLQANTATASPDHPLSHGWGLTEPDNTFHHTPRAPQTSADYPGQRWYSRGPDRHRINGPGADIQVNVVSDRGRWDAELIITQYSPNGNTRMGAVLHPESLRELARCLVDAATDIERGTPAPEPDARSDLSYGGTK